MSSRDFDIHSNPMHKCDCIVDRERSLVQDASYRAKLNIMIDLYKQYYEIRPSPSLVAKLDDMIAHQKEQNMHKYDCVVDRETTLVQDASYSAKLDLMKELYKQIYRVDPFPSMSKMEDKIAWQKEKNMQVALDASWSMRLHQAT